MTRWWTVNVKVMNSFQLIAADERLINILTRKGSGRYVACMYVWWDIAEVWLVGSWNSSLCLLYFCWLMRLMPTSRMKYWVAIVVFIIIWHSCSGRCIILQWVRNHSTSISRRWNKRSSFRSTITTTPLGTIWLVFSVIHRSFIGRSIVIFSLLMKLLRCPHSLVVMASDEKKPPNAKGSLASLSLCLVFGPKEQNSHIKWYLDRWYLLVGRATCCNFMVGLKWEWAQHQHHDLLPPPLWV